jgi:NADPH2:quinone reductase
LSAGEATALLVQGLTALGLLADLKSGQTILIHAAAGGVGMLLVQLAKLKGARVLGTASSAEKLEKVSNLGADVGINYTEEDWTQQVLEATEGRGADLIIEMVGGETGRRNFECLAAKGHDDRLRRGEWRRFLTFRHCRCSVKCRQSKVIT